MGEKVKKCRFLDNIVYERPTFSMYKLEEKKVLDRNYERVIFPFLELWSRSLSFNELYWS